MINLVVIVSAFYLIRALSLRLYSDLFTPMLVYSATWCLSLFFLEIRIVDYAPLSYEIVGLLAGSMITFVMGCIAITVFHRHKPQAPERINLPRLELAYFLLLASSVVGIGLMAYRVQQLFGLTTYLTNPALIRYNFADWQRWGVLVLFTSMYVPVFVISVLHRMYTKKWRWFTLAGMVLPIINAFLNTDRGTTVVMLCTSSFVWLYTHGIARFNRKMILACLAGIVVTLGYIIALGSLYEKALAFENDTRFAGTRLGYLTTPYVYLTASIPTLQSGINDAPRDLTWGLRSVYPLSRSLHMIGVIENVPDYTGREFFVVPVQFNAYTYLYTLYLDFGWYGAVFIPFFYGLLQTHFYLQMKSQATAFNVLATAMFMTINIFSIFVPIASTVLVWVYFATAASLSWFIRDKSRI